VNLYLDTSALVKLYVAEVHSSAVRRWVDRSDTVASSRVAYPEARAALARRRREGALSATALRRAVAALARDFPSIVVVEITEQLSRDAGELAERRALRGFDAIHLASALEIARILGAAPLFLAYDARMTEAAALEGLRAPD